MPQAVTRSRRVLKPSHHRLTWSPRTETKSSMSAVSLCRISTPGCSSQRPTTGARAMTASSAIRTLSCSGSCASYLRRSVADTALQGTSGVSSRRHSHILQALASHGAAYKMWSVSLTELYKQTMRLSVSSTACTRGGCLSGCPQCAPDAEVVDAQHAQQHRKRRNEPACVSIEPSAYLTHKLAVLSADAYLGRPGSNRHVAHGRASLHRSIA